MVIIVMPFTNDRQQRKYVDVLASLDVESLQQELEGNNAKALTVLKGTKEICNLVEEK